MQVTLPEKEVEKIQLLLSNLIQSEIKNLLNQEGLNSPYLNKQQACSYLGVSNNTLDSWIRIGLPVIRIGKSVRFNRNAIDNWLNSKH